MGGEVDVPRLLRALRIDARLNGNEWWAPCPNPKHAEHIPSWSIRDDADRENHGNHYCFGCEWGGDAIELASVVTGMSRRATREWLVEHGLIRSKRGELPTIRVVVRSPVKTAVSLPFGVNLKPLSEWSESARAYAVRRGITDGQVRDFRLGYAIRGRLEGRIVFPAYDKNGAITGYTSRTFRDHETRYLNPNTSEGFPEHKAIFGEHLWDGDSVVVTSEGAINVLSAHAVMPSINVAGLYGSHLKETQVLKLARFRKIVVLEDPDPTGRDYAVELKEAFFESDTRVVVAKMPDGYDPNALYCKDPEVLRCLIREAVK